MSAASTVKAGEMNLAEGLRVLMPRKIADSAESAHEHDLRHCVAPLLESLKWNGRSLHIAEAIPHFIDTLSIDHFRNMLANLGLKSYPIRSRLGDLEADLLPCLFIPDHGPAQVVISRDHDGFHIFDNGTQGPATLRASHVRGVAYIIRPNTKDDPNQNGEQTWLFKTSRRFHNTLRQILISSVLIHAMALATPLFMMSLYDIVIPSGSTPQLLSLGCGVVLGISIEWMLRRSRARLMAHTAGRIDYLIGSASFSQVIGLPLQMTENEPLGSQIARLQEFESIREFFAGSMGETVLDLGFSLMMLAAVAVLSGWLALVPLTTMALLVMIALVIAPFVAEVSSRAAQNRSRQQQFLVETLSNMRSLKLSGADAVWQERYRAYSADAADSDISIVLANNTLVALGRTLTLAASVGVVVFGSFMVIDGAITTGALIACITLSSMTLSPFQGMLVLLSRAMQIRKSITHINQLMKFRPERPIGVLPTKRQYAGRISLHNISYKHRTASDPALTNVSFAAQQGEVVALTGPSGGGKTTLVNLICGLYLPQAGNIFIDGIDIRQIDPRDIRQSIGIMPHTTELIYGTIAQNIRLAKPTATDQEIHDAAEMVGIHETILAMPEGYETRLTEQKMTELSKGLKQKLSFARALIRKPGILIIDEADHMLDSSGERAFLTVITKLRGHCTIILVTHEPSHLRMADRIIVLHGGRVQANGTYDGIYGGQEARSQPV